MWVVVILDITHANDLISDDAIRGHFRISHILFIGMGSDINRGRRKTGIDRRIIPAYFRIQKGSDGFEDGFFLAIID